MAIFWPISLLGCFGIAVLLLGLLFGWPLIWPTISTEGTDSFDGLSLFRSRIRSSGPLYVFVLRAGGGRHWRAGRSDRLDAGRLDASAGVLGSEAWGLGTMMAMSTRFLAVAG